MTTKPLPYRTLGDIVGHSASVSIRAHLDDGQHRIVERAVIHLALALLAALAQEPGVVRRVEQGGVERRFE